MATSGSAKVRRAVEDSLTCVICNEIFTDPRGLLCQHVYCEGCLQQHINASERARQIRCPLCKATMTIPENGADGFPIAFHQISQLDIYHKMKEMNLGSRSENSNDDLNCSIHKNKFSHVCETCNKLICQTCLCTFHKKHHATDLKSAHAKHKRILDGTKKQLQDQRASKDIFIQEIQHSITHATHQKDDSMQKVKQHQSQLIKELTKQVQNHSKTIADDIDHTWQTVNEGFEALLKIANAEKMQLEECINHIELQQGSNASVVKTSLEDVANFQDILREVNHQRPVGHFTVNMDCPPLTVRQEQVAVVECELEGGGPSASVTDIPTRTPRPHKLNARKLHQFDLDFEPSGITCTPAGNIFVCAWNTTTVRMYTPEGIKVLDLQTPPWTEAFDIDSTDSSIYVTGRKTQSVLVFDHQGHRVAINNISNVSGISGISVSNRKVYISGEDSNNVLKLNLSDTNKLSTERKFAAGVQLASPSFISARGDFVAISCNGNHCVHCVDSRGKLKYTHGSPDHKGKSANRLCYPWGVVFDRHNTLFIADNSNNRVCVVSDLGHLVGHIDLTKHQLVYPRSITIDTEGNLLVACYKADYSRYCIVKFGYSLHVK